MGGIRDWTDEERLAFAEFFDGLGSALAFYGLCVPKIRFCNIGGEDRRGSVLM
jgi:hypothetical protein